MGGRRRLTYICHALLLKMPAVLSWLQKLWEEGVDGSPLNQNLIPHPPLAAAAPFLVTISTRTQENACAHTAFARIPQEGASLPSLFLWTQLLLNKVLMVLTFSSNKPFPPIREDFGAGLSQGLWVLQRKRPDSP